MHMKERSFERNTLEKRELRPYQDECLEAITRHRTLGFDRQLVVIGTGLGKTITAAEEIRHWLDDDPSTKVLWLCHLKDVNDQSRQECGEWLADYDVTTRKVHSKNIDEAHDATITFTSFQTMHANRERFDPDHFDLLVIDETHHVAAPTYQPTLEYFKPKFTLGITGTPNRQDTDIRDIYGPEVYTYDIASGIADGYLVPIDYRVVSAFTEEPDVALRTAVHADEIFEGDLEIFYSQALEHIDRMITEKGIENPRMLIFDKFIRGTEKLADMRPDAIRTYHSSLSKADRRENLRAFKAGDVRSLVSVAAANEGINVPEINVLVFFRGTQSDIMFQQQLGRGLRYAEGKDDVLVLDFVNNYERLLAIDRFKRDLEEKTKSKNKCRPNQNGENLPDDQLPGVYTGSFHFDDASMNVMELLGKMRGSQPRLEMMAEWDEADSIMYYAWLSQKYGRPATASEIYEHQDEDGLPSMWLLTRTFSKSLPRLRAAAGVEDRKYRQSEFIKNWSREDSIRHYNNLYSQLGKLPSALDVESAANEDGMPSIWALTRHFGGEIGALRKACGIELLAIGELVPESEVARQKDVGPKLVRATAQKLGIAIVQAASPNGMRPAYAPEDAHKIVEAIQDVPFSDEHQIHLAEYAKETATSVQTIKRKLASLGEAHAPVRLRNPVSRRVTDYISPDTVKLLSEYREQYSVAPTDSYTIESVAHELEISYDTVASRLARGGKKVDEYWTDESKTRKAKFVTAEQVNWLFAQLDK